MPTESERCYLEQDYQLPVGLTWELVAERRALWGIADKLVPVAVAPGCVGRGVPHVRGNPLRHS